VFESSLICSVDYRKALEMYVKREDWYMWVQMAKGSITMPVFQSLDAYWPGLLVWCRLLLMLCTEIDKCLASLKLSKMLVIPLLEYLL
jgi:hypothetical protein